MVALASKTVTVKCSQCNSVQVFELNPVKLEKWLNGESIQNVFHEMSINDRESLISWHSRQTRNTPVICGDCFDKMFGTED